MSSEFRPSSSLTIINEPVTTEKDSLATLRCAVPPKCHTVDRTASPRSSSDLNDFISHESNSTSSTVHLTSDDEAPSQGLCLTRLLMAHAGSALALFLATTDATIVSTSLPTIVSDLHASQTQYTWVTVAYMLTQTACQPLYGQLSNIVGRKTILYFSMLTFALGSLLCAVAQNITWLIVARGVAGIGGGGIVSAVWVLTSEIVDVQDRAKWSQALSVTWSCSAVAGPLLGGLFSSSQSSIVNWRWIFYMNLPICLVAYAVLQWSLHHVSLNPSKKASWELLWRRFDFIGLTLFVGGTSCVVIGFSFASQSGWTASSTLISIILGIVANISGAWYEIHTSREALFPPDAFRNLPAVVILVITFLHNVAFNAGTFYLALYFEAVNGSSPVQTGLMLLPYSLGSSLASIPAALFMGSWQRRTSTMNGQKLIINFGLLVATLGFGLMILLREQSPLLVQIICPLIAGCGLGVLFHAPHQVFTNVMQSREIASGTSAFFLVRFTGATVGLAAAGLVLDTRLSQTLPPDFSLHGSRTNVDLDSLAALQPQVRAQVIRALSSSIQTIWVMCAPYLGVAFLISLLLHLSRPTKRRHIADLEKLPSSVSSEGRSVAKIPKAATSA